VLGSLADAFGLWAAHLLVPVLVFLAGCAWLAGRALESRAALARPAVAA
jgi:hypothetical protein